MQHLKTKSRLARAAMLLLVMVLTTAKSALATNLEWNFKFNTSEVTLSPMVVMILVSPSVILMLR